MKKYLMRLILSVILLLAAFSCFYFPMSNEITKEVSVTPKIETKTDNSGYVSFFKYVGIFLLVYSVWIWRDILKINQVGQIGGPPLEPSDPNKISKNSLNETLSPKDDFLKNKMEEQQGKIMEILKQNPANISNTTIISRELNLSMDVTERLLFEMQKKGLVRKHSYPGSLKSNYSYSDSEENQTIDFVRQKIEKKEQIIEEYRYVTIQGNVQVDCLFNTEKFTYIVETKLIHVHLDSQVIDRGIRQLLAYEAEIKSPKPLRLVLSLGISKSFSGNYRDILTEYKDVQANLELYAFRLK